MLNILLLRLVESAFITIGDPNESGILRSDDNRILTLIFASENFYDLTGLRQLFLIYQFGHLSLQLG